MCVPSCSPISHWITAADAWIKSPVRNVFPSLRGTMHVHSLTLEGWVHIHLPKPLIFSNLILRRGPESVICDIAMCLEPVLVQSSACSVEIETWCLQCINTEDGCGWTCRIKMLTWYLLGFLIILFHTRVQGIFNTATEKGPEWGPICQNIKKGGIPPLPVQMTDCQFCSSTSQNAMFSLLKFSQLGQWPSNSDALTTPLVPAVHNNSTHIKT